ncbi:hypothetical protein Cri9333_0621 [Crinalium epipsammum PCC 9333]|uniref:Uncharacterized protein n=1 Tax=Crinalium epipsammum PCC 9333 TaxID=1173022 RepID=K9VVJ5_9CYAN|nr:hypothetical protein [Crinalium epipsammum]AFZ11564.1 hypothetical protein Cri9333_0621 [Crinalium epipsammum PCC 9333]
MQTTHLLPPASTPITKFLPPYPTSRRAKMLDAVARLESTILMLVGHDCDPEAILLLAELGFSFLYSDECQERFIDVGMQAALEIYECSTINAEYEDTITDINNPRNWGFYQKATEIWKRQEKELGIQQRY